MNYLKALGFFSLAMLCQLASKLLPKKVNDALGERAMRALLRRNIGGARGFLFTYSQDENASEEERQMAHRLLAEDGRKWSARG